MRITFHDAAREVTGSMHLIEVNNQCISGPTNRTAGPVRLTPTRQRSNADAQRENR